MHILCRYLEVCNKLQLIHTSMRSENYIEGPAYSHYRWADSELIPLAKRELELGGHKRIIEVLHAVFGIFTVSSISKTSHTTRYQDISELLNSHSVYPWTLPSISRSVSLIPLELSVSDIQTSLAESGISMRQSFLHLYQALPRLTTGELFITCLK